MKEKYISIFNYQTNELLCEIGIGKGWNEFQEKHFKKKVKVMYSNSEVIGYFNTKKSKNVYFFHHNLIGKSAGLYYIHNISYPYEEWLIKARKEKLNTL
jgi:hypothetical protein